MSIRATRGPTASALATPRGPSAAGWLRGRGLVRPRGCGQAPNELAAVPDALAVRGDPAAVDLHQPSDERQTDAQTGGGGTARAGPLRKDVEDPVQHLGGDADPR